jgi:putative transposase
MKTTHDLHQLAHFIPTTNVFQSLLLAIAIATATQNELARQIKYLKVENQILRSKLPGRISVSVE